MKQHKNMWCQAGLNSEPVQGIGIILAKPAIETQYNIIYAISTPSNHIDLSSNTYRA
jgi:hypothetical protein